MDAGEGAASALAAVLLELERVLAASLSLSRFPWMIARETVPAFRFIPEYSVFVASNSPLSSTPFPAPISQCKRPHFRTQMRCLYDAAFPYCSVKKPEQWRSHAYAFIRGRDLDHLF